MSYHVTNENSFLDIKNAHLRVTGNVHTDVLKLGAIEVVAAPYQPTSSEVLGTTNFTNVTTGVTTSSNLIVGGVLSIGTVEVIATTHTLANTTAKGSVTPHTIEFSNVTTGLITTANVSVGRDLTVTGNVLISDDLTVTGNVSVSDDLTVTGAASVSNVVTIGTTKTFVVTMTNASGANKYYIDGYLQASLVLHQHQTYIFDLSSSTLSGHPFIFSETASGSSYDTGITTTGAYGSTEKRTFVVPAGAPTTLYYYCTAHSGMGGSVSISSEAELIVSGGAEFLGTGTIKLPSGTTDQRPATGINGMIRYNSTTGYMEAYTASGWVVIATPPTITSFDTPNVAVADVTTDTITVSGAGFDAITNIQLRGADGKNYDVADFTFTNSGSIGFKIGTLATGQAANRPYKVVVTNGAGLSATSSTTLGLGGVTWSSPAASSINDFLIGVSTSLTLSASDGVGGSAVTYTLQSGSYLSGTFTLSGTTITGTTNAAENTTSSVTIRATDNADSSVFLDRTFTLKAVHAALYSFSSPFTFTSAGRENRYGPTITDLQGSYGTTGSTAWVGATSPAYLTVPYQGVQEWTVPQTGVYRITMAGARGGTSNTTNLGGNGRKLRFDVTLQSNEKLSLLIGQSTSDTVSSNGGGGGGTFIIKSDGTIIAAAGGGGGASVTNPSNGRQNAPARSSNGAGNKGEDGGGSGGGLGGVNGGGGHGGGGASITNANANTSADGTDGLNDQYNPGGAGVFGDGGNSNYTGMGTWWGGEKIWPFSGVTARGGLPLGGFGGGGGGSLGVNAAQFGGSGGGGYSGGGGGASGGSPGDAAGGAGGSFINSSISSSLITIDTNSTHGTTQHGYVTVEIL